MKKWYSVNFDASWVTCRNHKCRSQFINAQVNRKNKCPACRMDNHGEITSRKIVTPEQVRGERG